ncbi:hypothetical protein [Sphingomonas hengshuiensis]|uniref:hypothetical protein n=1 Tax=Sphingomonas hengshuiensis TaxID=1609977 RepID=UPI000697E679|nr:hypothetical protein [Sphingomonas hengshuiensis]
MMAAIAALFGAMAPVCSPVPGAAALWQPSIRWVIVGEMHGTNETPDAFANLVCLASLTGRPVKVALEYPSDDQSAIDSFLASDGGAAARSALLKVSLFTSGVQDGRGSTAFLRLFERLRAMKQAGQITGVVASDVGRSTLRGQDRNAAMAQRWAAIDAPDNAIILSLVGNIHAMRKPLTFGTRTIVPAGAILPADRTVTINVVGNGGMAWNCQGDGCHAQENGDLRSAVPGITYSTSAERQWDGTYELGIPTTAALPANGEISSKSSGKQPQENGKN